MQDGGSIPPSSTRSNPPSVLDLGFRLLLMGLTWFRLCSDVLRDDNPT